MVPPFFPFRFSLTSKIPKLHLPYGIIGRNLRLARNKRFNNLNRGVKGSGRGCGVLDLELMSRPENLWVKPDPEADTGDEALRLRDALRLRRVGEGNGAEGRAFGDEWQLVPFEMMRSWRKSE